MKHIFSFLPVSIISAWLGASVLCPAQAQALKVSPAYLVVPGQSIGKIRLGQTTAQVRKLLGKPTKTLRLKNGLLDDLYRSKGVRMTPQGERVQDTLEVLYRRGRAVQIEVTSPKFQTRGGLSTLSTLRFLDQTLKTKRFLTYGYGDENEPGGYLKYYIDQRQMGLAFESISLQEDWQWSRGSQTMIVHHKGAVVIPDAGGQFSTSS